MTATDNLDPDPPQGPSCDIVTRLARELADAEFVECHPGLQDDDHNACRHPLLTDYFLALLSVANANGVPDKTLAEAEADYKRAASAFAWRAHRGRPGGMRRVVEASARAFKAELDLTAIRKRTAREYVKREGDKSRPIVNGLVRTGRSVLIDGVRVPVIEKVRS